MSKQERDRATFERDSYTCLGCGFKGRPYWEVLHPNDTTSNYLVVDHVDGRSEDEGNRQTLCRKCNCSKAGRSPRSFRLSVSLKRLGQCVAYYPALARLMGIKESIFLCQLVYWTPKGRHEKGEGWIYKSVEEMNDETGLSYKEQARVRASLVKQGLLEEEYDRASHRMNFRVRIEGLDALGGQLTDGHMPDEQMPERDMPVGEMASAVREGGTLPKGRSYKEQEITQETTQEKGHTPASLAEEIRKSYPRMDGKVKAIEKTVKAIEILAKRKEFKASPVVAARWLYRRVQRQVELYKKEQRPLDKFPYLATWMHQARYDDETLDLQRRGPDGPLVASGFGEGTGARDGLAVLREQGIVH